MKNHVRKSLIEKTFIYVYIKKNVHLKLSFIVRHFLRFFLFLCIVKVFVLFFSSFSFAELQ